MPVSHVAPQLATAADHALALHASGRGRVSIAQRTRSGIWRETSVPIADLSYVARQLEGQPDVYLTQNRFLGHRRLVSRLAELDALFVDLDYYKTGHADDHPQHVLNLAIEALESGRIPPPSFAVASGRGLALVWLHHPVPRSALPRWRACQRALWQVLRHLGADRLASDAARVLRLVGTRNSRSETVVESVTPVGATWDFDLLADEILPLSRADLIALRLERARLGAGQGPSRGERVPTPAHRFDGAGLWELRLAELQRLLDHRWFGVLPEGQRDIWMLLAGVAISYLVPTTLVHREIVALAEQATGGRWHERETTARMRTVVARAERAARGERIDYRGHMVDPRYRFCTTTMIEALGITEAEMRACGFRHLVSPEMRREHHRLSKQESRRASGIVPRDEYVTSSITQLKPWDTAGISRATWYRQRETSLSRCMVAKPSGQTCLILTPARDS